MIARAQTLCLTFVLILAFSSVALSQSAINGRVLDPQQQPVAGLEVLLHAVNENTGLDVDKDTTAADGTFELSAGAADQNAVYFVAVVWNGQLFMGDLMRPPFPLEQEYVVRVGVDPVDISEEAAGTPVSPQAQKQERGRGAVVIVAAGAVIAGLLGYGLRKRSPAQRRWLVELARLEEEISASSDASEHLVKRRAELRERLKAPKSG